ncbi:MAG: prepilin peptidase [Candidatus Electryonea clarkiae]|nr:prepilin peptidase [Candidatus Electryonea clarkiae]MDP8288683.1 prepilin peptidase [Candidatus Electryonea clarkiae]
MFWMGITGAVVGSFLNVVIHRVPKGESIAKPASHCPQCKSKIRFWNNIPLLSFWLLNRRCPDCGAGISIRYFIVEALGVIAAILPIMTYGVSWFALSGILLGWHLIALAMIDLETYTIPDHVVLPMLIIGLLMAFVRGGLGWDLFSESGFVAGVIEGDSLINAMIAGVVGAGFQVLIFFVSKIIMRREGIGGGDITMTTGFSVYLHPALVAFALVFASFFGIIGSVFRAGMKKTRVKGHDAIPFGPYLALGAWITFLYGGKIAGAYINWVLSKT